MKHHHETQRLSIDPKRRFHECESAAIDFQRRAIERRASSTRQMTLSRFIGRDYRFQSLVFGERERRAVRRASSSTKKRDGTIPATRSRFIRSKSTRNRTSTNKEQHHPNGYYNQLHSSCQCFSQDTRQGGGLHRVRHGRGSRDDQQPGVSHAGARALRPLGGGERPAGRRDLGPHEGQGNRGGAQRQARCRRLAAP